MFLFSDIEQLQNLLGKLEIRVATLESKKVASPEKIEKKETPKKEDDDDVDLFGSESEVSIKFLSFFFYFFYLCIKYVEY